ncbi:MAG TPA: hypothetical protein VIH59_21980 [Candidatus Tectomicrobia bacterium]|jgi:hypothetical protein
MMRILGFFRAFWSRVPTSPGHAWPVQPSYDSITGCHTVQEALLIGICLLRSGVLETMLYDATMAHSEGPQRAGVAMLSPYHKDAGPS